MVTVYLADATQLVVCCLVLVPQHLPVSGQDDRVSQMCCVLPGTGTVTPACTVLAERVVCF